MPPTFAADIETNAARRDLCVWVAVITALALQVQVTLFASPTYIGLRVNLADFLLPLLVGVIFLSLARGRSAMPLWREGFFAWAMALPALALCAGTIVFYALNGEISQWALVNKTFGYALLCGYFGAGAWLAANAPDPRTIARGAVFAMGWGMVAAIVLDILHRALYFWMGMLGDLPPPDHIAGAMANRNAFGFFMLCVCALVYLPGIERAAPRGLAALRRALYFLLPYAVFVNASRAMWIGFIPVALIALARAFHEGKKAFASTLALIAGGILALPLLLPDISMRFKGTIFKLSLALPGLNLEEFAKRPGHYNQEYDSIRYELIGRAVRLYLEHPLSGAGLGAILHTQAGRVGEKRSALDNTLLWILTETGPLGVFCFTFLFVALFWALWKARKDERDLWVWPMLAVVALFSLFSLMHEILYSRFMWFLMGMAMVAPGGMAARTRPAR